MYFTIIVEIRHPPIPMTLKTISHVGSLGSIGHSNLLVSSTMMVAKGRLKRMIKMTRTIRLQRNESK